jgi:plastocyanin
MEYAVKRTVSLLSLAILALLLTACPSSNVQITLTPSTVQLAPGATHEFTATVSGADNQGVRWENTGGMVMGEGTTVTYTAPIAPGTYTLTAVSQADPSRRATATINVVGEVSITLSPSAVRLEPGDTLEFTATVSGPQNQAVRWEATAGEVAGTGTTVTYTAPPEVGNYTLTVISQADPELRASASIEVVENGGGVSITLEPSSVRIIPAGTQEFTAAVVGLADTSVLWEVTGGSVSGTGATVTYTAPAEEGIYTLTATSQADPNLSATATIDVAGGDDGGSDDGGDDDGDGGSNPGEWCGRVSLAASSGTPGDRIAISGLPSSLETVYATVEVPGESAEGVALIVEPEEGGAGKLALLVPIHPTVPLAGGTVNLSITDGQRECEPISFAISPLANPDDPKVKNALASKVASLQADIADAANELGIDVATLKGDNESLAPEHVGLGILQFVVDHPDNPNSLVAVLDRGTVFDDGAPVAVNMALLNALVYRLGLFDISASPSIEPIATTVEASAVTYIGCVGRRALASATVLNFCMKEYDRVEADAMINEGAGEILAYFAILSSVNPIKGDEVMLAKLAASQLIIAIGLSVYQQQVPTEIASMAFDVSAPVLDEAGETGVWQKVELVVKDTSGTSISDLVGELFSNLSSGKILKKLYKITLGGQLFKKFVDDVKALVVKEMVQTYKGGTVLPIPYSSYGPVDITEFRTSYYPFLRGDRVITVNAAAGSYAAKSPLQEGTAQLGLRLSPGYFNNASKQATRSVTVKKEATNEQKLVGTFTYEEIREYDHIDESQGYAYHQSENRTYTATIHLSKTGPNTFEIVRVLDGEAKLREKTEALDGSSVYTYNYDGYALGIVLHADTKLTEKAVEYYGWVSQTVNGESVGSYQQNREFRIMKYWDGSLSGAYDLCAADESCGEGESIVYTWELAME